MAVFTPVQMSEITPWLKSRGMDALDIAAIGEGIENTNYRIAAKDDNDGNDGKIEDGGGEGNKSRAFVFTIFELWDIAQVRYYAALMRHFADAALPVPAPVFAPALWNDGKPCLLVPFVESEGWQQNPDASQCHKMGAMIARLHLAAAGFGNADNIDNADNVGDIGAPMLTNPRGAEWRRGIAGKLRRHLSAEKMQVINDEINRDGVFAAAPLPFGACHCDLFRNNVLWRGGEIAAVIDFYFGGGDALVFDLAVAGCDWCFDGGGFDKIKLDALVDGYLSLRHLCPLERAMLADAFCVAALRFWLSRLFDMHYPRDAHNLQAHDPRYFEDILMAAREMRRHLAAAVKAQ